MPISMQLSANYVTQSKLYSGNIVGKPLSDRRIAFYARQGRYGTPTQPKPSRRKKRNTLSELLKSFG